MANLRKISLILGAVALAVAGVACGEDGDDAGGQEQSFEVEAFDFYFEPTSLQFEPGARVNLSLVNNGEVAHSITINDLDFEAEAQGGDTIENTFTAPTDPGTLDFFCKFHPDDMKGTISIGGADQPIEEDVDTEDEDDEDVDVEVEDDTDDTDSGSTTEEY